MKKLILIPIYILFISTLFAQTKLDTIVFKRRVTLDIDTRRSFIRDKPIGLYGAKLSYQFMPRWRAGIGFYTMLTPLYLHARYQGVENDIKLMFNYPAVHLAYSFIAAKKWNVFVQTQYELGAAFFRRESVEGNLPSERREVISLVEGAVEGYYKVYNWIGIDAGVGYRTIIDKRSVVRESFSAPIYILKLKLFLNELYFDLFPLKRPIKLK